VRWSESDLAALKARQQNPLWSVGKVTQAHKFHAKGTDVDGIHFASKLEARCYEEQKLRRDVLREVLWFTRQVPFHLPGGVVHRIDFLCVLANGGVELIEAKGFDAATGRMKRKQVEAIYKVNIILWTGK
jgi:hypothetical protein